MKKFIVTGGSGFIGSNLVKFLLKKKFFVINIDKLSYSANPYNLREIKKNKKYKFFKLDINKRNQIYNIFNKFKPDGVFNLAAETHVDRSIDNPKKFIESNIYGVYNLLEVLNKYCKKNKKKIKFIHISTDEVFGDLKKGERSDENFPYNPSSPYSASKASADLLINEEVNSADSLNYLVDLLTRNENLVIQLEAHTDSRGTAASNLQLSQRRAETCVDFLVGKGISADRVVAVGHGEDILKITDAQIALLPEDEREAAHGENRRTVFKVIRFDYVPSE